jgi:hypothetical protein
MWPFGRKDRSLRNFPTEWGWSVGQTQWDGKPMFLRLQKRARRFAGHPELPFRLGVAVPLHAPNEHGLPVGEEFTALNSIEDALCDSLQPTHSGFLVMVITTNGMREFVFYVKDQEKATGAVEAARLIAAGHEVQYYVEKDADWALYRQFLKA